MPFVQDAFQTLGDFIGGSTKTTSTTTTTTPPPVVGAGLSTGAKIGIAAGGLVVLAVGVKLLTSSKSA